MAKKNIPSVKSRQPNSFVGLLKPYPTSIQGLAKAIRTIVYEELPAAEESFYGGTYPTAQYRTNADAHQKPVAWILSMWVGTRPEAGLSAHGDRGGPKARPLADAPWLLGGRLGII